MGESTSTRGAAAVESLLSHASADLSNNTNAVLVALPPQMDPIRLVGNEDKHATLLFFGEISTLPPDARFVIEDTIKAVRNLFVPFGESIESVSRLGSDTPPALVAMLSGNTLRTIRRSLLINPKISEYLKNTSQFPSYTPHVTLDYPDYTREAELRALMSDLYRVRFDRLALWWGNEQIEFSLNNEDSLAMSEIKTGAVKKFLAHFGVKGMRWGVRRDRAALRRAAANRNDSDSDDGKTSGGSSSSSGKTYSNPNSRFSDQELKALVDRMRLEKEFQSLRSELTPPKQVSVRKRGQRFVLKLIRENASRQTDRIAKSALDLAIEKALDKSTSGFSKEVSRELTRVRTKKK